MEKLAESENALAWSSCTLPEKRLAAVGGLPALFSAMREDDVQPDIQTFTHLLSAIPSDVKSENELLSVMKRFGVSTDIVFINMLIQRRNLRRDYSEAKVGFLFFSTRHRVQLLCTFRICSSE
jgi:hypothetical protein